MRDQAETVARGSLAAIALLLTFASAGCVLPGSSHAARDQAVADAARPILEMDPNAVWTDAFNRLVELGPPSLAYLMRQPAMRQPAAPGDLRILLHTSLVRLLADPTTSPPKLSVTCLETTLGLLHFDIKVSGDRLGPIVIPHGSAPTAWHELYPAEFDHTRAMMIDVEGDRRALCEWRSARRDTDPAVTAHRLKPRPQYLWQLLARRYADRWEYHPEPRVLLCFAPPRGPALLDIPTEDYNLIRAACVWLGSCQDVSVQNHLIDLVGDPSPVMAHNARFALRYSPDERVRNLVQPAVNVSGAASAFGAALHAPSWPRLFLDVASSACGSKSRSLRRFIRPSRALSRSNVFQHCRIPWQAGYRGQPQN